MLPAEYLSKMKWFAAKGHGAQGGIEPNFGESGKCSSVVIGDGDHGGAENGKEGRKGPGKDEKNINMQFILDDRRCELKFPISFKEVKRKVRGKGDAVEMRFDGDGWIFIEMGERVEEGEEEESCSSSSSSGSSSGGSDGDSDSDGESLVSDGDESDGGDEGDDDCNMIEVVRTRARENEKGINENNEHKKKRKK